MFFVLRISDLRASSNKKGIEANSYAARCTIPPVALALGLACLPYLTLGPSRDGAYAVFGGELAEVGACAPSGYTFCVFASVAAN